MIQQATEIKTLPVSALLMSLMLAGCAETPSSEIKSQDAIEGWNRGTQDFNDKLDSTVLKPVAKGYQQVAPQPVNDSVSNFFSNLGDIGVTVNDLLQLKILQGGMDLSRFLINTTVGVGGLFDVAKKVDLPKHHEDFGQTLGFWGVPSGTYLVLPFFGPSSPRDTAGMVGDALLNPLTYVSAFGSAAASAATTGSKVLEVTDTRADMLSSEKVLDEASVDRYDFIKNAYRQRREYLVHDGNPPEENIDDLSLDDDLTDNSDSATKPAADSGLAPVSRGAYDLKENKDGPAPVIDSSRHFLELSTPE
jgi:phospholipid-binding lipoprotein MlaA